MLTAEENVLTTQRASISVMVSWEMLIIYMGVKMSKLYRNWFFHNTFAHPISELAYWAVRPFSRSSAKTVKDCIHNSTIPVGENNA